MRPLWETDTRDDMFGVDKERECCLMTDQIILAYFKVKMFDERGLENDFFLNYFNEKSFEKVKNYFQCISQIKKMQNLRDISSGINP
jgi:hypothetical protein